MMTVNKSNYRKTSSSFSVTLQRDGALTLYGTSRNHGNIINTRRRVHLIHILPRVSMRNHGVAIVEISKLVSVCRHPGKFFRRHIYEHVLHVYVHVNMTNMSHTNRVLHNVNLYSFVSYLWLCIFTKFN